MFWSVHQLANQNAACFRKEKLSSPSPFRATRLTSLDEVPGDAQIRFAIHRKMEINKHFGRWTRTQATSSL